MPEENQDTKAKAEAEKAKKEAEAKTKAEAEKAGRPKAHPTSPVHTLPANATVTVPAGVLRKLQLSQQLQLDDSVPANRPTEVKVSELRKAGYADTPKAKAK